MSLTAVFDRFTGSVPRQPTADLRGFLLERLDGAGQRAARGAGDALAILLGRRIGSAVSPPVHASLDEIPGLLAASDDAPLMLLSAPIAGEIGGVALLAMPSAAAAALVRLLERQVDCLPPAHEDGDRSMLCETANIVLSAFVNRFAECIRRRIRIGAPRPILDLAAPAVTAALVAGGATADTCLALGCHFRCAGERIAIHILLLPSESTLPILREALDEFPR